MGQILYHAFGLTRHRCDVTWTANSRVVPEVLIITSVPQERCAAENVVWYYILRIASYSPPNIEETLSEELRARVSTPDYTLVSRALMISSECRGW